MSVCCSTVNCLLYILLQFCKLEIIVDELIVILLFLGLSAY